MALSASLMTQWSVLCMVRGLVSSVDIDIVRADVILLIVIGVIRK